MGETQANGHPSEPVDAAPQVPTGRGPGWDSAFYRFAEGVRTLTGGRVNYKVVYAAVGTNARYINHTSAVVRKRTAASLSRLMHSSRYAADFRAAYAADDGIFATAAHELAGQLRAASGLSEGELLAELAGGVWPEMCEGLSNELRDGRHGLSRMRIERESEALLAWCDAQAQQGGHLPVEELLSAAFHMMAFGCLDERFAHMLLAPTADAAEGVPPAVPAADPGAAVVVRVPDDRAAAVSGVWRLDAGRPFAIGRYTDCDAIERDPLVSRLHCRIYHLGGTWYVEDAASTHGTQVLRDGDDGISSEVFSSLADPSRATCALEFGDRIVLAGRVTYRFRALAEGDLI